MGLYRFGKGLHFAYPGKGGYKESYDPQRPWYQWAQGKNTVVWGQPYLDASGQGLLLPCVQSLYAQDEKKLGVAGVELSLAHWLKNLLPMANSQGIENIYLLNQLGEIVVQTKETKVQSPTDKLVLTPYPEAEIRASLKHKPSGHAMLKREGQSPLLVAYTRLNSIGWYYVVESNADLLFKPASK